MFAENATEWFERTWTKYSFLIGTQNGSMKAEDRWKRYDMTPQLLQGEVDDYLKRMEKLHTQHCGQEAQFITGENLTYAGIFCCLTPLLSRLLG